MFVAVLPSWMPPEAERLARFLEYDHWDGPVARYGIDAVLA